MNVKALVFLPILVTAMTTKPINKCRICEEIVLLLRLAVSIGINATPEELMEYKCDLYESEKAMQLCVDVVTSFSISGNAIQHSQNLANITEWENEYRICTQDLFYCS
ncbi:unnamed protein product [Strongylus vulgaris]|uniref:Saposin B-type domain-containing protein n=1 Tax=Strongylus vulgaris TaxID=40348 RepID=A0A3P7J4Y2_STRVU|nr:unnamed protein product [Strongylus vulgaris]